MRVTKIEGGGGGGLSGVKVPDPIGFLDVLDDLGKKLDLKHFSILYFLM